MLYIMAKGKNLTALMQTGLPQKQSLLKEAFYSDSLFHPFDIDK